jgi:predicted ABC-type ATPase
LKVPVFIVIAGANGAGKSTLTNSEFPIFSQFPVLDPDVVAKTIQSTVEEASPIAAGRQVLHSIERFLDEKRSFAIETTLSGKNYLRTMTEARQREFQVILVYIGTESVEINITRIANRVLAGGHNVPETDVRRRYIRSFENLLLAIDRADEVILFDNSTDQGYQLTGVGNADQFQWMEPLPRWAEQLRVHLLR